MPEESRDPTPEGKAPRDDVDDYIFRKEEDWLVSDR